MRTVHEILLVLKCGHIVYFTYPFQIKVIDMVGKRGRGRGRDRHVMPKIVPSQELCDYEKIQRDNIRERQELFKKLGFGTAKRSLEEGGHENVPAEAVVSNEDEANVHEGGDVEHQDQEQGDEDQESDKEHDDEPPKKKKKVCMTKKRKAEVKREEAKAKFAALTEAKELVLAGAQCAPTARQYGLPEATLRRFVKNPPGAFKASRGRVSKVLNEEQEQEVVSGIIKRKNLGYGMTYSQLQASFQIIFQKLCAADPAKRTGFEATNQLPPMHYVYRFVDRRASVALRAGMQLTSSRAAFSLEDCAEWYRNFEDQILSKPEIAEAMLDPRRVCNAVSSSLIFEYCLFIFYLDLDLCVSRLNFCRLCTCKDCICFSLIAR